MNITPGSKKGFSDNVFLVAGSLVQEKGGVIIAHNTTCNELLARLKLDPFVSNNIVTFDACEFSPAKLDDKLSFLNQ